MNKKEKIILLVVILIAIIICMIIAIKIKDKKANDASTKDNNIYNIKVDQKYSKSKNKFTITFSNVKNNLYIKESG